MFRRTDIDDRILFFGPADDTVTEGVPESPSPEPDLPNAFDDFGMNQNANGG